MKKIILISFIMCLFNSCGVEAWAYSEKCTTHPQNTPSVFTCGKPNCFWETNMDVTKIEDTWAMLMQPMITVKGNQKNTEYLRSSPDQNATAAGEVTCASQGVHVLETLDSGWSLIECYSSSFHDSKIKAWNELVTGYIETNKLETIDVQTEYALIVDKLTQRMYVFCEGELLDSLAVSTGLPNDKQPYNETRAGEYILVSPVGDFPSGNMTCGYGMRFNNGDLLHEVPYLTNADGTRNYSYAEADLGERASHGCIRVQRLRTSHGINMKWIWDTLKNKLRTRIVIWEDDHGRQIPIPRDDLLVYINPDGGKSYHASDFCYGVREQYLPLTAISYLCLNEQYQNLTACQYCVPVQRKTDIEKKNREYAEEQDTKVTITIE
ncbi:MAG: L,D-transpeptidase [Clostridia bacterium]